MKRKLAKNILFLLALLVFLFGCDFHQGGNNPGGNTPGGTNPATTVPRAPAWIRATKLPDNGISITWELVPEADYYIVYYSIHDSDDNIISDSNAKVYVTTFNLYSLGTNVTVYCEVTGGNSKGEGPPSSVARGSTS